MTTDAIADHLKRIEQLSFPASARASDPDTSQDAAKAMKPEALRHRLLRSYATSAAHWRDGLTDDEAGLHANIRNGWWKRCAELRKAGLIHDTGFRRVGDSGKSQMVCKITEDGRNALR